MRRALVLLIALAALAPLVALPVQAEPPASRAHDYLATPELSAPTYAAKFERPAFKGPDGTPLHVEVNRPDAPGRFGVIIEASPYHGTTYNRQGGRILPQPVDRDGEPLGLVGYFVPRGYVVLMMDLRGTGLSGGCLDHLGPADAADLGAIVTWASKQPWSNGKVGLIGHSYPGGSSAVAAAQHPEGLATVVLSASLASMYDHQFQAGVPYNLQWAGPMFAYAQLAVERDLPGGERGDMTGIPCAFNTSSLTTGEPQLSGQYVGWHRDRDHRAGARTADIPMFVVHGVNDNAARIAAVEWFHERQRAGDTERQRAGDTERQRAGDTERQRAGDKVWIGQWDHGVGCCPNRRGLQWTAALHAWFDKTLGGHDVDTGPPVELFLNDAPTLGEAITDRTEVVTSPVWPPDSRLVALGTDAGGELTNGVTATPGTVSFAGDTFDLVGGSATFVGPAVREDILMAGMPELRLVASVTTPRVHLIANVYDQDAEGNRRRITQFAINPELRSSIRQPEVVVPGQRYVMHPPGYAMAHRLRAGHRLVLRVTTTDPDKVPTFATDPNITVFAGPGGTLLRLPVVTDGVSALDTVPGVDVATE